MCDAFYDCLSNEMVLLSFDTCSENKMTLSRPNNMYFLCPEVSLEFLIAPFSKKKKKKKFFLIRRNIQKWIFSLTPFLSHNKH